MIFNNSKIYDALKWFCLVGLPAIQFLWIELAQVWGFPYADAIGKTIAIVAAALGMLIGVSAIKYQYAAESEDYYETESEDELPEGSEAEDDEAGAI